MKRTISGLTPQELYKVMEPDGAFYTPELRETLANRQSEQSGQSADDWTAREYRRIG